MARESQRGTKGKARRAAMVFSIAAFLAFLAWSPFGVAQYTPGTGIMGSPHDFSTNNTGRTAGGVRTGACTYCHTPHRASRTRLLWNKNHPPTDYTWGPNYTVTNDGGTPLPTIRADWLGPTVFCLTCHDGSVTIGDIAWFNKQSWTGTSSIDTRLATAHVSNPFRIEDFMKDMIGEHPVAAPYPYLRARNTYNGVTNGTGLRMDRYVSDPTASSGGRIRLFQNVGGNVRAGAVAGNTGIECTTCHGVHNERGVVQGDFLLRSARNNICNECHL